MSSVSYEAGKRIEFMLYSYSGAGTFALVKGRGGLCMNLAFHSNLVIAVSPWVAGCSIALFVLRFYGTRHEYSMYTTIS